MFVLDQTLDQVIAALRPKPHLVSALRRQYEAVFRGGDAGPLIGEFAAISRRQADQDVIKFAQRLYDGLETESVILPMRGRYRTWTSLCVSSQVGCAMGCTFCETARLGLLRNLTAAEIVGQVVAARREMGADVQNVVFMGMGEPMDNFDAVIQAVRVINDPGGLAVRKARITISTVGRVDGIRKLGELVRESMRRVNLAVSLNAPNDEIRAQIMPINRKDDMTSLMRAIREFPLRSGAYLMIEYVLIPGVNDQRAHAEELAAYLRPIRCCVNLIPYNPRRHSPWPAPRDEDVFQFRQWVLDAGQPCMRRITKGRDFMAACGQLGNPALSRRTNQELDAALNTAPDASPIHLPVVG
jgi:23S rRNA (adenine2503-C2)-methyltransferase